MKPELRKLGLQEIPEVKKLDDSVFAGHQKISLHELRAIAAQNGLFGLFEDNKLVAEAQLLLKNTDFYSLENPHWAYCYGIGVDKTRRGRGYAKMLICEMEKVCRNNGKIALYLASRPENYTSLRLWEQMNYHIFDYKPAYFGSNTKTDTRLLLKKEFHNAQYHSLTFLCKIPLENDFCDFQLRQKLADLLKKNKKLFVKAEMDGGRVAYNIYTNVLRSEFPQNC